MDKSCDVDVDDELLPEHVDSRGTTRGTKLSVLQTIVFSSLVDYIRGLRRVSNSSELKFVLAQPVH